MTPEEQAIADAAAKAAEEAAAANTKKTLVPYLDGSVAPPAYQDGSVNQPGYQDGAIFQTNCVKEVEGGGNA